MKKVPELAKGLRDAVTQLQWTKVNLDAIRLAMYENQKAGVVNTAVDEEIDLCVKQLDELNRNLVNIYSELGYVSEKSKSKRSFFSMLRV